MPTTRSYQDQCGIARALDVVGECWSLLIVRELLLGPQRFSELRRVLANTSSNIIADPLRELEAKGAIQRRQIPAPAASWVYEVTPWGKELEPIVLALGWWGLKCPRPPAPAVLGPTTVLYRPSLIRDGDGQELLSRPASLLRSVTGSAGLAAGDPAPADYVPTRPAGITSPRSAGTSRRLDAGRRIVKLGRTREPVRRCVSAHLPASPRVRRPQSKTSQQRVEV